MSAIVTFLGKLCLCQRLLLLGSFVYVSDCNISWETLFMSAIISFRVTLFMSAIVAFPVKLCLCQRLLLSM